MNIVFLVPWLRLGGYEKVVVNYANAFSELGHNITILCGFKDEKYAKQISPRVKIVEFKTRFRNFIVPLTIYLKKNSNIDILYAPFHSYTCLAVMAKKVSGSKAVIYSAEHGFEKKGNFIEQSIVRYFIKKADVLIAVSNEVAAYDANQFRIDSRVYYVFDNPVYNSHECVPIVKDTWIESRRGSILVTVGRLAKDKHIEIPIKILSEVAKSRDVSLLILGDGEEREQLQILCENLEIADKVHFKGTVANPISYLKKCDIYLHTSEIESFGNGVIEAQYCNLPAIVTDCGGPVKLIEKNKYGINIGKYNSTDVIKNGVNAVLKILDGEVKFGDFSYKARKYDAINLEEQFLEPYYECIKKN